MVNLPRAFLAGVALQALVSCQTAPPAGDAGSVYEVRSYHYDAGRIEEYRHWAENHALPHLRERMDVIGFWVDGGGIEPELTGAPLDELGSATVTWVIRWDSKEQRDATWAEVTGTDEWASLFAELPGGREGYHRIEARFMDGL